MTGDTVSLLMILSLGLPLLLVLLMGFRFSRSLAVIFAPWAAFPALLLAVLVVIQGDGSQTIVTLNIMLGSSLSLDATSKIFFLLSAVVWALAGIYSRYYFDDKNSSQYFYLFYLLCMTGNLGLNLAQDVLVFLTGFSLMGFSAYGLIAGQGNKNILRAGRTYIVLLVFGELLLFEAILMAAQIANSTSIIDIRHALIASDSHNTIMLLLLLGLGIKVAVIGLHVWLPVSMSVVSPPVAAVISAIIMQAGLFGIIQLIPLGEITLPVTGQALIAIGLITGVYAVISGLFQQRTRTLLGYTAMIHMGLIFCVLGLGFIVPDVWPVLLPAIGGYVLSYGLGIAALLFGLGIIEKGNHRWIWLGMLLPALAMTNAPVSGGFLSIALIQQQIVMAPAPWNSYMPVAVMTVNLASAFLMARLLYLIRPMSYEKTITIRPGLLWTWLVNLVGMVVLSWWVMFTEQPFSLQLAGESLLPAVLSLIAALLVITMHKAIKLPDIPQGDFLLWLECNSAKYLIQGLNKFSGIIARWQQKVKYQGIQLYLSIAAKLR